MFKDEENYQRAQQAQPITTSLIAKIYAVAEQDVVLVYHDAAKAIKVSIPRPIFQCELADSDCYGGQQYVPLLELEV